MGLSPRAQNMLLEATVALLLLGGLIAFFITESRNNHVNYRACEEKCKPNAVYNFDKNYCTCDLTKVNK